MSSAPLPKLQTCFIQLIFVLTFHLVNLADVLLVLLVRFHRLIFDGTRVYSAPLFRSKVVDIEFNQVIILIY